MKNTQISLDKAKQQKLFYFVVTGFIYRASDKRCLILQRSKKEIAHPGLYGPVGGKLEWQDLNPEAITRWNHDIPNWENSIEQLLYRETKEECGLTVSQPKYLSSVAFVRPDNVPVICAKFGLRYESGNVKVAPEFDGYAWVNEKEVKDYDCILGVLEEVVQTINVYSSLP